MKREVYEKARKLDVSINMLEGMLGEIDYIIKNIDDGRIYDVKICALGDGVRIDASIDGGAINWVDILQGVKDKIIQKLDMLKEEFDRL